MKRKIAFILMLVLIITIVAGCVASVSDFSEKSEGQPSEAQNASEERFQLTGQEYEINGAYFSVVVDTETQNLYLSHEAWTYGERTTNLTPLYDENGEIDKYESN